MHDGHPGGFYCHGDGDEGYDGYCLPTLSHNEIYDNEGPGISVGPDAYVKADGNTIRGGKAGLLLSGIRARGMFTENTLEANMDGVVLREGACPTLERNVIRGQTRKGVLVCARGQGVIVDNDISDAADANVEVRGELVKSVPEEVAKSELETKKRVYANLGMLVPVSKEGVSIRGLLTDESGATSLTLRGNRVRGGGIGVRLADHAKGFVKQNDVAECASHGLEVSGGADPDVVGNTVHGCGADGLRVRGGGKGRFQDNVVHDCVGCGCVLETGGQPDIRANEARSGLRTARDIPPPRWSLPCSDDACARACSTQLHGNGAHGILVEDRAGGRLSANLIRNHAAGCGIKIVGVGATTHLRSNRIEKCAAGGVHVVGARQVVLVENEIVNNGLRATSGAGGVCGVVAAEHAPGVRLSEGADPLLEKNAISGSGAQGVLIESNAKGQLLRNVIELNGAEGLRAHDGCTPFLVENYVRRNAGDQEDGGDAATRGIRQAAERPESSI